MACRFARRSLFFTLAHICGLVLAPGCGGDDAVEQPAAVTADGGADAVAQVDTGAAIDTDGGQGDAADDAPQSTDVAVDSGGDAATGDTAIDGGPGDVAADAGSGDASTGDGGCQTNADCADMGGLGPCQFAVCDTGSGTCVAALVGDGKPCDDGDACTGQDACKAGQCQGGEKLCACQTNTDCVGEDDADLCNGTLVCDAASKDCVVDLATVVTCDTSSDGACAQTACEPKTGACKATAASDGQACDDGSACTASDGCKAGACAGSAVDCDDGNPCTADSCDAASGCQHAPNALPCDDGDACTTVDACSEGQCTGSVAKACDDGNPCTDDGCDKGKGCTATPNGAPCDDGNACTQDDVCGGGKCQAGASTCGCQADADCAKYEDGDLCNGTLVCDKGQLPFTCKLDPASVVACDGSGDTPCLKTVCDAKTGSCGLKVTAAGTPCDDGNACTNGDTCKSGSCVAGGGVSCNDGNPCTNDTCDPGKGCAQTASTAPCDDGNPCTPDDKCKDAVCQGNGALPCVDGNACTKDSCAAKVGCQFEPLTGPCSDGNACTSGDTCQDGQCTASATTSCDDGNPCTVDACDGGKGCAYSAGSGPCDDGNACTANDKCATGNCQGGPAVNCNDGNPCTDDACDKVKGCASTANTAPCNDGDACTTADACNGGACAGGAKQACDDGNGCTDDACDKVLGCAHLANAATCTDDNACTTGDACQGGSCKAGGATACDDGNACTDDKCDPKAGCQQVPNQAACDDGNVCTAGDVCNGGKCKAGAADAYCCNADVECGDGLGCTTDKCSNHVCANTPAGPSLLAEDFDGDFQGWQLTSDNKSVKWQISAARAVSGKSLYMGNPAAKTYNFGQTLAVANMPAVQLPTGTVTLSFHAWVQTEDNNCLEDVLNVLVDGTYLDQVCESTNGWAQVHVDLTPYQGRKVVISFAFDTADNIKNNAEGIYLDDVVVRATQCGATPCSTHAECHDLNDCTGDLCVDGACQRAPEPSNGLYWETFDDMPLPAASVPQGWALTSSNGATKWAVSDKRARTGKQSLYAGNPATGKYDNGASKLQAKLAAVQVPAVGKTTLVFYAWRDVADQDCAKDRLRVYVGAANQVVAEKCGSTGGQWELVSVDLTPFASQVVQPIVEFDTVDASNNGAEGVYVDDVTVFHNSKCEDMFEIFDDNSAFNWKVDSSNASVWWHISTNQKFSGIRSFYAGNSAAKSYNYGATEATATTGFPVCYNATLQLRLRTSFGETNCSNDGFEVRVGAEVLYQQCASTNAWTLVNVDLAKFGGVSVPLVLRFHANGAANAAEGVFVDDVWLKCP